MKRLRKITVLFLILLVSLLLAACGKQKTFALEYPKKVLLMSGNTGESVEIADEDVIRRITDNMNSVQLQRKSKINSSGWSYNIRWYDDTGAEMGNLSTGRDGTIIFYDGYEWAAVSGSIDTKLLDNVLTGQATSLNDRKPMLMIDGKLYLDTGIEANGLASPEAVEGEILSTVAQTEKPNENGQSNYGAVGNPYYFDGENVIVWINNKWFVFQPDNTN